MHRADDAQVAELPVGQLALDHARGDNPDDLAAALGLLILPNRRRKAKADLQAKLARLREDLVSGLSDAFERETRRSVGRIDDTVAPFARFVRVETEKLTVRRDRLAGIETAIAALQAELDLSSERGERGEA